MMIVLSMSNVPPKIRGDLTKWLLEIDTGVYIGNANPRVRDGLWRRVCENIGNGRAVMVFSTNNEQRMGFYLHNSERSIVDFDGFKLVKKPLPKRKAKKEQEDKAKAPFVKKRVAENNTSRKGKNSMLDVFPSRTYNILDIETTGLYSSEAEITEIGMLRVIDGIIDDTFSCLVRTEKPVPDHVTAITGIDNKLLAEQGIDIREAMDKLLVFAGDLPIVCFSASFDRSFVNKAAEKVCIDVNCLKFFDAHRMLKSKMPGLGDYKLLTIARKLGVSQDQKHRALDDSLLLYGILSKLNENIDFGI